MRCAQKAECARAEIVGHRRFAQQRWGSGETRDFGVDLFADEAAEQRGGVGLGVAGQVPHDDAERRAVAGLENEPLPRLVVQAPQQMRMLDEQAEQPLPQPRRMRSAVPAAAGASQAGAFAQPLLQDLGIGVAEARQIGDEHVAQGAGRQPGDVRQRQVAEQGAAVDGSHVQAGAQTVEEIRRHRRRVLDQATKLLRSVASHQRVRVFAVGQKREAQLAAGGKGREGGVHGLPCRGATGGVAVEAARHDVDAVLEQAVEVCAADGRSERCHGIVEVVLGQCQHIHVALHDHHAVETALRLPRLEEAVKFAALAEVRGVRRVEVFRPAASRRRGTVGRRRAEDAPAEADDAPAGVANREDDALPKTVVGAPALVLRQEASVDELGFAVGSKRGLDPIPSPRRQADGEALEDFRAQPALAQVGLGLFPGGRFVEPLPVACGGGLEQVVDAGVDFRPAGAFPGHLHASQRRQRFHRLRERQAVEFHQEADAGAVGAAAEAVVTVRVDVEGRRLLLVEGAQAGVPVADPPQFHATADHLGGIDALDQRVDEGLRNLAGHGRRA